MSSSTKKKSRSKKQAPKGDQEEQRGSVSPEAMETTRSMVQPLIEKPKLTDKLLSRPPFRFLHDVVSNVAEETGFLRGYFQDSELQPKEMEKQDKLAYLQKLIDAVQQATGQEIPADPVQIVRGHEPDKTNELLQALGKAAGAYQQQQQQPEEEEHEGKVAEHEQPQSEEPMPQLRQQEDEAHQLQGDDFAGEVKRPEQEEEEHQAPRRPQSRMSRQEKRESSHQEKERRKPTKKKHHKKKKGNVFFPPEKYGVDGTHELTRSLLGKIISRPKLTDKLLSKPPIRFLHDIVMNVQEATGFANGLYSEEQKDSANVKQKDDKLKFLTQLVDVVGIHLRTKVPADPTKIVAGLESEKTNILLQLLAIAATSGTSDEAVAEVCSGEHQKERYNDIGEGPINAGVAEQEDGDEDGAQEAEEPHFNHESALERQKQAEEDVPTPKMRPEPEPETKEEPGDDNKEVVQPSQSRSTSNRPQTARKRPPKSSGSGSSGAPGSASSRQGSADNRKKDGEMPAGVMAEGAVDSDSEEEEGSEFADLQNKKVSDDAMASAGKGKHTRDILKHQRKHESKNKADNSESKHDSAGGIRFGKIKAKKEGSGFSVQDIEKLRGAIQKLCQSTNPLGKSLDYVHDDLDDMRMELNQWKAEYEEYFAKLQQERKQTEEEVIPYKSQLQAEEQKCEEARHKITGMKTSISKNEQRIRELLEMVVHKGSPEKQKKLQNP